MLSGFVLFSAYLNKPKDDSMFGMLGCKSSLAASPSPHILQLMVLKLRYVLRRSGTIYPLYAFALLLETRLCQLMLKVSQSFWRIDLSHQIRAAWPELFFMSLKFPLMIGSRFVPDFVVGDIDNFVTSCYTMSQSDH